MMGDDVGYYLGRLVDWKSPNLFPHSSDYGTVKDHLYLITSLYVLYVFLSLNLIFVAQYIVNIIDVKIS